MDIQGPRQTVIVELGRWNTQDGDEHRAGQPVGHLIQGQRQGQPVEHQDQGHHPVVHLGPSRAVAVDNGSHLQRFQQSIQHRQGTKMAPELGSRHQVNRLCQGQRRFGHEQERQTGDSPNEANQQLRPFGFCGTVHVESLRQGWSSPTILCHQRGDSATSALYSVLNVRNVSLEGCQTGTAIWFWVHDK
jgi:hypothetical protein